MHLTLKSTPLAVDCALGGSFAGVEEGQTAGPVLGAGGEGVLSAGLVVPVPGDDAGVVAGGFVGQVADGVLGELAFQLQGGGVAGVGEAVLDVAAVPDDGVDFGLDALQGVGEFGDAVGAAAGEDVAQGGAAAL